MTVEIATTEPSSIKAGMTVKWKRTLSDYPATLWTLTYVLFKTGTQIKFNAVPDGDDHSVTLAKATTAAYTAGRYTWQAYVDDGSERFEVDSGTLEILTDFDAQSSGYDARTTADQMVDGLTALLIGNIANNVLDLVSYGINADVARNIVKMTLAEKRAELSKWREDLRREQEAENIANGLGTGRKIYTRFSR